LTRPGRGAGGGSAHGRPAPDARHRRPPKPPLAAQATTLWDYPSRTYTGGRQGDDRFRGATPAWLVWNVVSRFAPEAGIVVDPFCGSGTTLDVCRDLGRRALGFDVHPVREDIANADARSLPVKSGTADLVFMDPPYGDNLAYSEDPRCLGRLSARDQRFDRALGLCFAEAHRVLRDGGVIAVYICDVYHHPKGFFPIGFRAFEQLRKHFVPLDIVAVPRRSATLEAGNYQRAAREQGFLLRGFNYLFLMEKRGVRDEG
jgi:SAM-dependent methyltransferase